MKLVSQGVGGDSRGWTMESSTRRRRAAYDNIIILTWGLGVLPPSSLCV